MTTECLDCRLGPADRRLHDAVLGLAVAVIVIIPATLAVLTVL